MSHSEFTESESVNALSEKQEIRVSSTQYAEVQVSAGMLYSQCNGAR